MILAFDMVTAIFPVRINKNSFWSSDTGLACLDSFLTLFSGMADIDRFFVITQDTQVCHLAEKYGMSVLKLGIPGRIDRPYTFEQTMALAQDFQNSFSNQEDDLIIIDHRNILISPDDVTKAMLIYRQNPNSGVISLTSCRDHPCQYKSYFTFLDCVIIRFDKPAGKDGSSDNPQTGLSGQITYQLEGHGEITIRLSTNGPRCCISFHSPNKARESFVAQILPFAKNGPLYGQSREILVTTPEYETLLDIDAAQLTGMIFILTMPSQAGEYDTVEIFTPPNASWELGGSGSTVANTKTHEPMFGRQQFPSAYTYDGSLCILGVIHLPEKMASVPNPLILKDSCIVTDWVDYWYTGTAQLTADNLPD